VRGRRASIAFLGAHSDTGTLATPSEIVGQVWKISPAPSLCINTDAGSMHPRQCDSINMMCNLPNFKEWVEQQRPEGAELLDQDASPSRRPSTELGASKEGAGALASALGNTGPSGGAKPSLKDRLHRAGEKAGVLKRPSYNLREIAKMATDQWAKELTAFNSDVLADSSINNVIYTKLKETFAALLDAAVLSGSAIVVDRTAGMGSATAEILLELAIERLSTKPTIIAVDSLERLGKAKSSTRAHRMIEQLSDLYHTEDAASQAPNGSEREAEIDWLYETAAYDKATIFADIPDNKLPFDVLPDHQRKAFNLTCDPNRKWRYFYIDGLFASATHYIIKSADLDELDMETLAPNAYLYAHGDTRTFKRLRDNIQKGAPIVMLHNSGGPTTAFSWLQRVMAFQRPPPGFEQLCGPLKFLIATLSAANWTIDFGAPEVLMMRSLAERAPQLFRKSIVSVDILTESEEQVIDVITSCFATSGGVPALGLGNAEVNVIFAAWRAHLFLVQNSKRFWRYSIAAQVLVWSFAIVTTATVTVQASLGTGHDPNGAVLQREMNLEEGETLELSGNLNHIALILPILAALLTTIMSKFLWRDRWSVALMCATQLVSEIYKFRCSTLQYDMKPPPPEEGKPPTKPLSAKEKSRLARMKFVERVSALYGGCLTELAGNGALKKRRVKVPKNKKFEFLSSTDNKPSMAEWFKIKLHVEKHFYKSRWVIPSEEAGTSFLHWMSGLRPYLQQRTLKEELQDSIKLLVKERKVVLRGGPLTDSESTTVRHTLAASIGLPKKTFDKQKAELRTLQRSIVLQMNKEERNERAERAKELEEKKAKVEGKPPAADESARPGSAGLTPRTQAISKMGAKVAPTPGVADEDEENTTSDPAGTMRRLLMEEQGLQYGKLTNEQIEEEKKKKKKKASIAKAVDDDYLCGALSVETYMMFRCRPLKDRLERQVEKLSMRLQVLDVLGFILNSTGAVFAAYKFSEWIALTVMIVSVLSSIVEFTQLRNQVVSCNLALRDLEKIIVKWDSLSLVRRRTPAIKQEIVDITESAFIMVVAAHTTAAANTQVSLAAELEEDGNDEE